MPFPVSVNLAKHGIGAELGSEGPPFKGIRDPLFTHYLLAAERANKVTPGRLNSAGYWEPRQIQGVSHVSSIDAVGVQNDLLLQMRYNKKREFYTENELAELKAQGDGSRRRKIDTVGNPTLPKFFKDLHLQKKQIVTSPDFWVETSFVDELIAAREAMRPTIDLDFLPLNQPFNIYEQADYPEMPKVENTINYKNSPDPFKVIEDAFKGEKMTNDQANMATRLQEWLRQFQQVKKPSRYSVCFKNVLRACLIDLALDERVDSKMPDLHKFVELHEIGTKSKDLIAKLLHIFYQSNLYKKWKGCERECMTHKSETRRQLDALRKERFPVVDSY